MPRIAACAAVGAVFLTVAGIARAHVDVTEPYLHRGCPAGPATRVDPVNVVFHDWGTWGRAVTQIEAHAGWADTSGSTLSLVEHGSCVPQHAQRASGQQEGFPHRSGRTRACDQAYPLSQ